MTDYIFGTRNTQAGTVDWYGSKVIYIKFDNGIAGKTYLGVNPTPKSVKALSETGTTFKRAFREDIVWTEINVQHYEETTDDLVQELPIGTPFIAKWSGDLIQMFRLGNDGEGRAVASNSYGSNSRSTSTGTLSHLTFIRTGLIDD